MKKSALIIMAIFLSLTFVPFQSRATDIKNPTAQESNRAPESEQAKVLLLRLDEIKAMDKSELKASERQDLRKEVKSIKKQLSELDGGMYISVGAIIIILLLLIILL